MCLRKLQFGSMREHKKCGVSEPWGFILTLIFLASAGAVIARTPRTVLPPTRPSSAATKIDRQDDFVNFKPAPDLALHPEGERKAGALAHLVEGMASEENGEMDRALESYGNVLTVDPGQSDLASRAAVLPIPQAASPHAHSAFKG